MRLLRTCAVLLCTVGAQATTPKPDSFWPGSLVCTSTSGLLVTAAPGLGSGSAVPTAALGALSGLAFGPDGRLYVTAVDSEELFVFGEGGASNDSLALAPGAAPTGLAFGPDGLLWIVDDAADELYRCNVAGTPQGALPLPPGDYGSAPAFGPDGHVFIAERGSAVLELSAGGELLHVLGAAALSAPAGLAVAPDGRLLVADGDDVVVLDAAGEELDRFGTLQQAAAVVVGPDGHVYVADAGADEVREFSAEGEGLDTFTHEQLAGPAALAFVPWRFAAKIKGDIAQPGQALAKVKELDAVLSLLPGSGTLMLALTDDVTQDDDLASVFGTSLLVLHGFEAEPAAAGGPRLWQAAQLDAPALAAGFGTLSLRVTGSTKNQQFVPKQAKGTLHRASTTGVYAATVKTGKPLD